MLRRKQMVAYAISFSMDKDTEQRIADGRIKIISPLEIHFLTSDSQEEAHISYLDENNASGSCSCQHFDFRIRPKISRGEITPHEAGSQCKHIVLARLILGDRLIKASIGLRNEKEETNEEGRSLKTEDTHEAKPDETKGQSTQAEVNKATQNRHREVVQSEQGNLPKGTR